MKKTTKKSGKRRNKEKAEESSKMDEEISLSERTKNSTDNSKIEKEKLRREIARLEKKIVFAKSQNTIGTKFADLNIPKKSAPSDSEFTEMMKNVDDLQAIWLNDIYTYAGFYCVKETETEYIFNFGTSDGDEKIYCVQILMDGAKKCSLGKWVMPFSMDLESICRTTPLDDLSTIAPFLKFCKKGIDCYRRREIQYNEFKKYICGLRGCEIDGNPSFTHIIMRIKGVYNKPKDSYIDMEINLLYKTHEALPYDISADWDVNSKGPTNLQKKEMRSYVKYLRDESILEGFKKITESSHPIYSWEIEEYVESPLELNNSSDSDEESINLTARRKRKRMTKKRQKEREIKERWNKRQRTQSVSTRSQDLQSSGEEIVIPPKNHNIISKTESPEKSRQPKISKKLQQTKSTDVEKSTIEEKRKSGRKLRQTTISFAQDKNNESESKKSVEKSSEKISERKIEPKKSTKIPIATKNLAEKKITDKKSQKSETKPTTLKKPKSEIPASKTKPRILSIKKIRGKASSTPISNRIHRTLIPILNENVISPIASINESD